MEMQSVEPSYPKWSAQVAVRTLLHFNVKDVVISPGTRDMPLILACDAEPRLNKHIVVDERCAAFTALGMATASCRPVALVCTSGSALLNYAPALAEAYYRHVPLIVLSADRPERWIDQADSQTIRQVGALSAVVKKSVTLPDCSPDDDETLRLVALRAFDAISYAIREPQGPVHLNLPFGLPLGPQYPQIPTLPIPAFLTVGKGIREHVADYSFDYDWRENRILVVCGQMLHDNSIDDTIDRIANHKNIAVIAENISNLHTTKIHCNIDAMLREMTDKETYQPDIVIVCGGALVSAALKQYLRSLTDIQLWYVGKYADMIKDTFDNLSCYIDALPQQFFSSLSSNLGDCNDSDTSNRCNTYSALWNDLSLHATAVYSDYIDAASWSELKATDFIIKRIPKTYDLHLSNGMSIRYALLSARSDFNSINCNRGVSGIEGATSTAVGAAIASKNPTILISGDMSFSYDIAALALKEIPTDFKAIVLSNRGGGIFRFISKTNNLPQREKYFCAEPKLPLRQLAEAYGFRYLEADSMSALEESWQEFLSHTDAPTILNVIVDTEVSTKVISDYFHQ